MPNSTEDESLQAPSAAPPVAAPKDANVLMFGLLKQMTNFMGILTIHLKPNEAAASGSTGVKVVKRLPIKIPPPKAFEGDRDYERVATWLREVENFFRAIAVEGHQKVQTVAGLLGGDVLTWWAKYIKDQEIVESEMFWTEFKALVTSRFTPEYANICARMAWLDLRQTHPMKAYVGKFQGVVSTLQHMSDYDKQLKFIHRLQPWARKLIFQMPQLPDNLQDLIRMAKRLGDDTVDKKEPGNKVRPAKVAKDNNSWQERKKRKKDKHTTRKPIRSNSFFNSYLLNLSVLTDGYYSLTYLSAPILLVVRPNSYVR